MKLAVPPLLVYDVEDPCRVQHPGGGLEPPASSGPPSRGCPCPCNRSISYHQGVALVPAVDQLVTFKGLPLTLQQINQLPSRGYPCPCSRSISYLQGVALVPAIDQLVTFKGLPLSLQQINQLPSRGCTHCPCNRSNSYLQGVTLIVLVIDQLVTFKRLPLSQ